ncbi:MAG: WD40 repeat domain-containing protein [Planctomycetaceae bacterium]
MKSSQRFDASGTRIVTTSRDQTAKLWNVSRTNDRMSLSDPVILTDPAEAGPASLREGHRYLALSFAATADASRLWIGGVDGTLRAFDISSGTEEGTLTGTGLNSSFALSPNGRLLLTASSTAESSCRLWRIGENGELPARPEFELSGHESPATAFAISLDEKLLFTGDQRGTGYLWNARTGERVGQPLNHHGQLRINSAAFLADGRLLTASDDRTVVLVDTASGELVRTFNHDGFVTAMSLDRHGKTLLTISEQTDTATGKGHTSLRQWDIETGNSTTLMRSSQDEDGLQIRAARFSPTADEFVTVHASDATPQGRLRLWSVAGELRAEIARTYRLPGRLPPTSDALLLGVGSHELLTLHSNSAFQWSLSTLEHHRSFRSHGPVRDAAFSADGRFVATCSESVKIWDAASGQPLYRLESPHEGGVTSVTFSPVANSSQFLTTGNDGQARLWNWNAAAGTVEPIHSFPSTSAARLHAGRFSGDGRWAVVAGAAGEVRLLPLTGDDAPVTLSLEPGSGSVDLLCVAFSPDARYVVAGGRDKKARLWELSDEAIAAGSVLPKTMLSGHADVITSIGFLPQSANENAATSSRVLTASGDRSARVWDADSGRELIALRRHSLGLSAIDAIAYPSQQPGAEDSIVVMTAGLDGRVILWPGGE